MNLALNYAWRDLRGTLGSFRIVLLCLILGVGAIAAVQFISTSVLTSIQKNGRSLLGGDLLIRNIYAPAPAALRARLTQAHGIITDSIESRVMLANMATSDNTLVELKAVSPGYPLFGSVTTDAGSDLPALLAQHGILLDPSLQGRLHLSKGDRVRLGTGTFTVRGFIQGEPDRAGGSNFGLAPRAMIAAGAMADTGLLMPGSMMYYNLRVKFPDGADVNAIKKSLRDAYQDATWRVTDADNAAPGITRFIDRLVMFLTLVGLSALLIGGIGIGNGVRAHFKTRLKTIAILKTLGAPTGLIERIYLVQIALIALTGTMLGSLFGAIVPFLAAPYLSRLLPFPVEPHLTLLHLLLPLAFGLLVSFAFTLWPLGQAVATSPLELFRAASSPLTARPHPRYRTLVLTFIFILGMLAIVSAGNPGFAIWFVTGAIVSYAVFNVTGWLIAGLAARVAVPRYPALQLAVRNLHHPGNATVNTLISLGLGLTVMVAVTLIEKNLREGVAQNLPVDAPAFFFLDVQGDQVAGFTKLLQAQPSVRNLRLSANLRGRIVSVKNVPAAQALVDKSGGWLLQNDRGFTYAAGLPAHSELLAGQWWPSDYSGPPLVSVVDDVAKAFGVKPGDRMTVNILGRDITATIANVRSVNWLTFTINYAITFAPGTLEAAPHSWIATVVADPAAENAIQRAVGAAYPNISMIRVSDSIKTAGDILGKIATAVRITALVTILTGILVLAGSLAATRTQRLYDIVVLKVLGVRNATLTRAFLLEFGLLGAISGTVAVALGAVISWAVMTQMMSLGWNFYAVPALLTGLAGIGLTIVIGWVITGSILKAPASQYLRND